MSKEQVEIAKLKTCIQKFKEYDAARKKHYAALEQEIGILQSEKAELEDTIKALNNKSELIAKIEKLKTKNKNLKDTVNQLQKRIEIGKANKEEWALMSDVTQAHEIYKRLCKIKDQTKTIKQLRDTNCELAYLACHPDRAEYVISRIDAILHINQIN